MKYFGLGNCKRWFFTFSLYCVISVYYVHKPYFSDWVSQFCCVCTFFNKRFFTLHFLGYAPFRFFRNAFCLDPSKTRVCMFLTRFLVFLFTKGFLKERHADFFFPFHFDLLSFVCTDFSQFQLVHFELIFAHFVIFPFCWLLRVPGSGGVVFPVFTLSTFEPFSLLSFCLLDPKTLLAFTPFFCVVFFLCVLLLYLFFASISFSPLVYLYTFLET